MSLAAADGYADYALRLPDGIVVHELVNAAGLVFEVTWSGKGHRPDMARLLGSYGGRIVAPAASVRPMSRRADVVASDLVIHSAVHSRYFSGTAHVPALLPSSLAAPVAVPANPK